MDGLGGSSLELQAIADQTENYAISWGSYLKINETMSDLAISDQNVMPWLLFIRPMRMVLLRI